MGAPDSYELRGSYNDAYRAMGDAVAVPVTRWLTRHLLAPLVARTRMSMTEVASVEESHLASLRNKETVAMARYQQRELDV
jgi:hypothetical protein